MQIGQIVKIKEENFNTNMRVGTLAKIVDIKSKYYKYSIEYFERIKDGHSCGCKAKMGCGRYVKEEDIEPAKVAVNCPTKQDFKEVLEYIESVGGKWWSGNKPTENIDNWNKYKEKTCLDISKITSFLYGNKIWYKDNGYPAITAQQYLGKEKTTLKEVEEVLKNDLSESIKNSVAPERQETSGNIMQKLTAKIIRTFSPAEKELFKAGYVDENNNPTTILKDMIGDDIIEAYYKENKKVYVELAKEINKEK